MFIGQLAQLITGSDEPQVRKGVAVESVLAVSVAIDIKHLGYIYPGVHVKVVVGCPVIREETHLELQRVAVMNFWLNVNHCFIHLNTSNLYRFRRILPRCSQTSAAPCRPRRLS